MRHTPANRRKTGGDNPVAGSEATRWKPGQSGNPCGRPKTAPLSQACREVLTEPVPGDPEGRTYAEKDSPVLAERAADGDIRAAQELADRVEGRPRQAIEIEHTRLREAFERLSTLELEAYAVSGILPAWFPKRMKMFTNGPLRPEDFPLGSPESRAAARARLNGRDGNSRRIEVISHPSTVDRSGD